MRTGNVVTALVVLVVLGVVFGFMGCRSVDVYEAGVRFNKVTNQLTQHGSGITYVFPFVNRWDIYDLSQRTVEMSGAEDPKGPDSNWVRGTTKDGQTIFVDVTLIWRIEPSQVMTVHRSWQDRLGNQYVIPAARSAVRDAIGEFEAQQIYDSGRPQLKARAMEYMQATLSRQETGELVILEDMLIRNVTFDEDFLKAIENKQIQEQEAQQAENRIRQAEAEANQARAAAQGEADAQVIAAEGEAQAIILQAEAQADATRLQGEAQAEVLDLVAEQLEEGGQDLINWTYVNELGEEIDLIIIPSNSPYLFDFQQMLESGNYDTVPTPVP